MLVLILGGGGMLGHQVWAAARQRFDVRVAVRRRPPSPLFDDERVIEGFDASDFDGVARLIERVQPDAVINCVGVVKQLAAAHDPIASITINSLFPHIAARSAARLIQISTDCVFSGKDGPSPGAARHPLPAAQGEGRRYREDDDPDPVDLYGRSKLLGEVGVPHLTLRTSIVGQELGTSHGLLEWFLGQTHVKGFTRALFSGLSTVAFARILCDVVEHHRDLQGLYHVAGEAISKYDLLMLLNDAFHTGVTIEPDDSFVIDRTLDGSRFAAATSIAVPSWNDMAAELAR